MGADLRGQAAVITGAGSGIGAAAAVLFAQAGVNLLLADISEVSLTRTCSGLGDTVQVEYLVTDVSDASAVKGLFARAQQSFGSIDILLNAAGALFHGTVLETDDATWNRLIAINLTGTFLCCREVLPIMIAHGRGSIINVASTTGDREACAHAAAYVASKGGVTLLTKALAVDHAAQGVRVNALCPGPTDTPMLRRVLSEEQMRTFAATLPMGRLGQPEELAKAILFLASEDASFVTGSCLVVDGGQTAQV